MISPYPINEMHHGTIVPVFEPRALFRTDHVNIHPCISQAGLVGYDNPPLLMRSLVQIVCVIVGLNLGVSHSSSCFFS